MSVTCFSFSSPNTGSFAGSLELPKPSAITPTLATEQQESTMDSRQSAKEGNYSGGFHLNFESEYLDQVPLPYTYASPRLLALLSEDSFASHMLQLLRYNHSKF
ncbi:hypothetical protein TorRG33x02_259410 [Trema orientale]|uniref:Uncharacterized protein n=1 Tax=Trema orientale TaxID=63057 RepID=A0A2P5D8B4_TREOI|nr:hypothetical protein TorRG33x02_259410 [Trema orientale]